MLTRKIPATIVTGFLGAGKTTLLRHLLSHAGGRRIAVIVNEFGALGIDGELLRGCGIGCEEVGAPEGRLFELANGCLCCTVQEEFYPMMARLAERREQIEHLVIETSGLALPKPLVQAFQWPGIRPVFTVDAVLTVVDAPAVAEGRFADDPAAVDAQRRADAELDHDSPLAELFEDQLAVADLVVLNKTDALRPEDLPAVEAAVRAQARPGVKLLHARHGALDPALLLGLGQAVEQHIDARRTHHDDEDEHDHDAFESVCLTPKVSEQSRLIEALAALVREHEIYRIKGFVDLPGAAMRWLVQGVGARFDHRFDRAWAPGEARRTQLVVIGQGLDPAVLQRRLDALLAA